ncbi:unnamed protein product [Camellia sinensis]
MLVILPRTREKDFCNLSMADSSSLIDPELVISHKFPETTHTYTERDAALYALGVGACGRDALDKYELKYVYHEDGQQSIQVLPTFGVLFAVGFLSHLSHVPGLQYDPRLVLHGQQYIEIYKPFPSSGCMQNKASISGLHDKGKAAILEVEIISYEKESSEPICLNRMTVYLRGAGGFSKSSHPYSYSKNSASQNLAAKIPNRQPFAVYEECTQPSQIFSPDTAWVVHNGLCGQGYHQVYLQGRPKHDQKHIGTISFTCLPW